MDGQGNHRLREGRIQNQEGSTFSLQSLAIAFRNS